MRGFHFHFDTVSKNLCVIKKNNQTFISKTNFGVSDLSLSNLHLEENISILYQILKSYLVQSVLSCSDGTNPKFQNFKLA